MKQLNQEKINQLTKELKILQNKRLHSTETFSTIFENYGGDFLFDLSICLDFFKQYKIFLDDKICSNTEQPLNEAQKIILAKQKKLKELLEQIHSLNQETFDIESDIELIIKQNNAKCNAEFKRIEGQINKEYLEAGYVLHTVNISRLNRLEKNHIRDFLYNNNIIFKTQGERIKFLQTPEFKKDFISFLAEKSGQEHSFYSAFYQLTDKHGNYPQYLMF